MLPGAATVKYLTSAGKKVVILKDVPLFNFDPVRAIAAEGIPMRKWVGAVLDVLPVGGDLSASESEVTNKGEIASMYIDVIAKQYSQITVVDPSSTLCAHGRCSYRDSGNLYYTDFQHVSEAGANVVLEKIVVSELLTNSDIPVKVATGMSAL